MYKKKKLYMINRNFLSITNEKKTDSQFKNEMGLACGMYGREDRFIKVLVVT